MANAFFSSFTYRAAFTNQARYGTLPSVVQQHLVGPGAVVNSGLEAGSFASLTLLDRQLVLCI